MCAADAGGDVGDATLLRRFAAGRDEAAFAALVDRHGPLVWGVCRRLLPRATDAEDAFQATFLVLVRKAGSIRQPELLGPWLHGVARRVAVKLRATATRRQARERPLADVAAAETVPDAEWSELRPLLDDEVNRLPDRYRVPFVLCHLEGLTNEEAARRLGCPRGTILSRLARARERLRQRLTRRGIGLSGAALAAALAEPVGAAPVPAALAAATMQLGPAFAAGAASTLAAATTISLAEGVLTSMFLTQLKTVAAVLLALSLVGAGGGLLSRNGAVQAEAPAPPSKAEPLKPGGKAPAVDKEKAAESVSARPDLDFRDALARRIKFNGVDDPKTTLTEALDILAQQFLVQFNVNEKAFKAVNFQDILKMEIAQPNPIAPMNASLDTVLRKILDRVPSDSGATYLIRKDHIEITTEEAVRRELGLDDDRPLPVLVYQDFEEKPLQDALKAVAAHSGINLVVDPATKEPEGVLRVSARLHNVTPETAVKVLANMGNMALVRLDNVYYVTTPEKAAMLRKEQNALQDLGGFGGLMAAPPNAPPPAAEKPKEAKEKPKEKKAGM